MWALVQDGLVLETTDVDPDGRYHPDLKWRPCPVKVLPGWMFENGVFARKVETQEQRDSAERQWRDGELATRQWLRDRHRDEQDLGRPTTLSNEQFTELLGYFQALRDWPQVEAFPDSRYRPVMPAWVSEQHL